MRGQAALLVLCSAAMASARIIQEPQVGRAAPQRRPWPPAPAGPPPGLRSGARARAGAKWTGAYTPGPRLQTLVAPANVEATMADSGGLAEPSQPPPLNETEQRSLNGVHVTIWQPPHRVRGEDWRRVGEAVQQVCKDRSLPLDGNTFCVCRLRVPIDCRCHSESPRGEKAAVEAEQNEETADRREELRSQLEGVLEQIQANRTAAQLEEIEQKKAVLKQRSEKRKEALREWWAREETRVGQLRDEAVPSELERLVDRNLAHQQDEARRRELAEAKRRAAEDEAQQKVNELQALRERLQQVRSMRAKKLQRQQLERDVKSKQAEVDRLISSLEVLKHDNELRVEEYEEWQQRAKAMEKRYRAMLRNLGPWGEEVLQKLEEELEKAQQRFEEEKQKEYNKEQARYRRAEQEFKRRKRQAFTGPKPEERMRAQVQSLQKRIRDAESRYRAMLHGINNVTESTPCRVNQDCGADQRCAQMQCASVARGTACSQHAHCANEQRCTDGKCAVVDEDAGCSEKRDCANWQRCKADGKCSVVFDGTHCVTTEKSCANEQVCDTGKSQCRGEYDLEEELLRRRREEQMLRKRFNRVTEQRVKAMQVEVQRMRSKSIEDGDVVKQMQQLAEERRKLQRGRTTLEKELQRRAAGYMSGANLPAAGGAAGGALAGLNADAGSSAGSVSTLDAAAEIRKLQEEIERLQEELGKCRTKPHVYVPTCESDLKFQIKRLQEEVLRRKALMLEEVEQMKVKQQEVSDALSKCRARGEGCPEEEEQRLLLSLKQLEDQVESRQATTMEQDKVHVMQCLLDFKDNPHIKKVEDWFRASLDEGCKRIKSLEGEAALKQCLCKDWEEETRIRLQAEQRAKAAEAQRKSAETAEAKQRAVAQRKREQEKEMAKEVAKEVLYEKMKGSGQLQKVLDEARKTDPELVDRLMRSAKTKADPQAALRDVSSAAAAASASRGPVQPSQDLVRAVEGANSAAKAESANHAVSDPLKNAFEDAQAGRAVQDVADSLSEAESAVASDRVSSQLRDQVKDAARLASSEAKEADASANGSGSGSTSGKRIPPARIEKCLQKLEDETVKENIRSSFTSGHAGNGCALLSLAGNKLLNEVHHCLCSDVEAA